MADDPEKAETDVKEKRYVVSKDRKTVDNETVRFDKANSTYF
jgi:hypothetical protein